MLISYSLRDPYICGTR